MTRRWAGLGLAIALLAFPATAIGKDKPLFADEAPLQLTVSGPLRMIAQKAKRSTDPYPATIEAGGETHPIELAARGFSRRTENCEFPPLRVTLTDKPPAGSLFAGQHKLKLVVHCRDNDRYEQLVLREYAAYRLYNLLAPASYRVRLARVTYVDGGKQLAQRWGFFIEDTGDLADRLAAKEIRASSVPNAALDPAAGARVALFEYMIANSDWEFIAGPAGQECCHNSKLLGPSADARRSLIPVPYDFDYTGLVNAPYALPAEAMRLASVRGRRYWGLCQHNDEVLKQAPAFVAARPALEAQIAAIPGLDDGNRRDMIAFLAGFFADIATPDQIGKRLLKDCRR